MKRLLIALVAAVAVSTGFARIVDTQSFEDNRTAFVATGTAAGDDASALVAYPDASAMPTNAAPYNFSDYGFKYFELDTGDATVWYTNECAAPYFDMVMQFNPSASEPDLDGETKIAVYVNASSNLVVLSGNGSGGEMSHESAIKLDSGTWARLTIAANGEKFFVSINGKLVKDDGYYPRTSTATIKSVGFKGSGALDDFVARTTDPFIQNPAATIGGEGYASYTDALKEALKYKTSSETLTITANARTMDGTAANPYQIASADDLIALKDAVLANEYVRSLNFVQTANIDMASAGPFAGIGTYAANLNSGVPFMGTYDGAGFKILNVDFTQRNYGGIFNQVKGGTIKNLTVENITCSTFDSSKNDGEWGCAIVGNAGLGATLQNLTAEGDFGSTSIPCSHNVAGIAIRICGGASNVVAGVAMLETLVQNCTNNATLHGFYTKCAGITALTQDQNGVPNDYVLFDGCVNNANIAMVEATGSTLSKIGRDGLSGILGYVADGTKIKDCVNNGTLASALTTAKIGGIVGWAQGRTLEDLGGNANMADQKMIGDPAGSTITGFQYATVDNGVATTVTGALAKDTTYLLERNVAASEAPVFTLAAVGDTIAFDTALDYTFAGTVDVASTLMPATSNTDGTVTTYTTTAAVVATVGTQKFATLQAAITAADEGETKTVNLVGAATGAVTIPEGITVQLSTGYSLADVTTLAGNGVLKMPWGGSPQPTIQLLCQQSTWEGTLYIHGVDINSAINLTLLGNANSTVCFNSAGCALTTGNSAAHAIKALEIGPNGFDLIGNYSSGTFMLPCALSGTGMLKIAAKNSQYGSDLKVAKFTGDVSGFTGSINFDADAHCAVYFGDATGDGNCISVAAGKSVTVAAGKTWNAPGGVVVNGTLVANGTVTTADKLYGTGVYQAASTAAAITPDDTWTGTYVIGWAPTGAFNPNNYGSNSVVELAKDLASSAYFGTGSATNLTINPTVRIAADVEIKNGFSKQDDSCLVTFTKLTGDHKFTTSAGTGGTEANPSTRRYAITTLDNFTGSLKVKAGSELRIATVNVADGTKLSGLIIPAECDAKETVTGANADGMITGALALTVAGVDNGKTLEYKADGAQGAGLYVASSTPEVVPGGDPVVVDESKTNTITTAVIQPPTTGAETYTPAEVTAYQSLFKVTFTPQLGGSGFVVGAELDESLPAVQAVVEDLTDAVEAIPLANVVAGDDDATVEIDAVPGLYYGVATGTTLENMAVGTWKQAKSGDAKLSLDVPAKGESQAAGFYRIEASATGK